MNYKNRQTGQVVHLIGCGLNYVTIERDPYFAERLSRVAFERLFEPICEDEGLLASRKECDGLRIDLAAQKAIVTNLKVERDHLRTVADNRNSHLELIRVALDQAATPDCHDGLPGTLAKPMTLAQRIEWLAKYRDEVVAVNNHIAEERNEARKSLRAAREIKETLQAEVEQLKAKLTHEEGLSALLIEKRTQAEDVADQLRVELARVQADLAGLNARLTPLRMKLTAAALNGLLSNQNTGREYDGDLREYPRALAVKAIEYADEAIAAFKEVSK